MQGGFRCESALASLHTSMKKWRVLPVCNLSLRWRSCASPTNSYSKLGRSVNSLFNSCGRNSHYFFLREARLETSLLHGSLLNCWQFPTKFCRTGRGLQVFGDGIRNHRRIESRMNKGFKRGGRKMTKLEQGIEKGFKTVGLQSQYHNLPQWSGTVPYVAAGLETLLMFAWVLGSKGRSLRGGFSGDGLLILIMGLNFIVGWLASLVSTWRLQALKPSLIGREKKVSTRPGVFDFLVSFWINFIPFGNFLAWLRTAVKESRSESAVNALVYVVPSLFRLVLWSQGMTIGRVEQVAWLLGAIHRPFDGARVRNDKLIATVELREEKARKAKELNDNPSAGKEDARPRELTVDELALIQQRKELEDFDILLAKSQNSAPTIPGPPKEWSVGDVLQWLADEGFARYASTFAENDIDGAVLVQLTSDDLRDELEIQSLGDRRKLEKCIEQLKFRK